MQVSYFQGFRWDEANFQKCRKHGVSLAEIEHVLSHGATLIVINNRVRRFRGKCSISTRNCCLSCEMTG